MNTIQDAYINSLLADATYAFDDTTRDGITGVELANNFDLKERMTPDLAQYIGDNFTVVTHVENGEFLGSGFDATIWKRNSDGQVFVSMQGTQGFQDFATDANLTVFGTSTSQLISMVNWWLRVTTPEGQMVRQMLVVPTLSGWTYEDSPDMAEGTGQLAEASQSCINVMVNGHSLGGHLAAAFARLFGGGMGSDGSVSISGLNTFNSAGFTPGSDSTLNAMADWLGAGVGLNGFYQGQNNYYADNGISATTRDFMNIEYGNRIPISNEESEVLIYQNHFMYKQTDALALGNMMSMLDSSFDITKLNTLLNAGSNKTEGSIESVLDAIRKVIDSTSASTPIGDDGGSEESRVTYYQNLFALQGMQKSDGSYDIEPNETFSALKGNVKFSVDYSISAARNNFGDFLSFYYGLPFSIHTNNSTAEVALQEGRLSIYNDWIQDIAKPDLERTFTDQYLQDRAVACCTLQDRNTNDNNGVLDAGYAFNQTVYFDYTKNIEFYANGGKSGVNSAPYAEYKQMHFGGSGSDTLTGGDKADHLYGGAGVDTLNGGKGNDYLEGGSGVDIYQFSSADTGSDTIVDKDGGTIKVDNATLTVTRINKDASGSKDGTYLFLNPDGTVQTGKEGWSVIVNGTTATITTKNADNEFQTIEIKNFDASDPAKSFGIVLNDATAPTALPGGLYEVGNGVIGQYDPPAVTVTGHWDYSNSPPVWIPLPEPVTVNEPPYAVYLPIFRGAENNPDYASQGVTWDQYRTKAMHYRAAEYVQSFGYFEGSNKDDVLEGYTTDKNHLIGYDGDDVIYGDSGDVSDESTGNDDTLVGGRGSDTLFGGGGDDVIYAMDSFDKDAIAQVSSYYQDFLGWNFSGATTLGDSVKAGTTTLEDEGEENYLNGGDGNDKLYGASYRDTLIGGAGEDTIFAGAGQDQISGGSGKDIIWGDSYARKDANGNTTADFIAPDIATDNSRAYFHEANHETETDYNDVIDGGSGDDAIYGEIGDDVINGGADNDTLFGDRAYNTGMFTGDGWGNARQKLDKAFQGDDVIDGGTGNDMIIGGGGNDVLIGGDESNTSLSAYGNNDEIYGDVGLNSYEIAGAGATALTAESDGWWGDDYISGGKGNDLLIGEGGNDTIDGGDDDDKISGDWAWFDDGRQNVAMLDPNGKFGEDTLYGGAGNDSIVGGGAKDFIDGGSGNDVLWGDAGLDSGFPYAFDDTLIGGTGNDSMQGEGGNDTYIVRGGDGKDYIYDVAGSNILQLVGTWLKDGKVQYRKDGDNYQILTSSDKNNYVSINEATKATITFQDGSGNILMLNDKDVDVGNYDGVNSPVANIASTAGANYNVHNDANNYNILQMASDVLTSGAKLGANLINGAMQIVIPGAMAEDNITLTINDWNNFVALQNTDYEATGFVINQSSNTTDGVTLLGKGGNDVLTGGSANESFLGGDGDDVLTGGAGNDVLSGEEGNDTYVLATSTPLSEQVDTIVDTEGSNVLQLSGTSVRVSLKSDQVSQQELSETDLVQDNSLPFGVRVFNDDTGNYTQMSNDSWRSMHFVDANNAAFDVPVSVFGGGSERYEITVNSTDANNIINTLKLPDGFTLDSDFSALKRGNDLLLSNNGADLSSYVLIQGFFANRDSWQLDGMSNDGFQNWVDQAVANPIYASTLDEVLAQFKVNQRIELETFGAQGKTITTNESLDVSDGWYGDGNDKKVNKYTFHGLTEQTQQAGAYVLSVEASESNTHVSQALTRTYWDLIDVYQAIQVPESYKTFTHAVTAPLYLPSWATWVGTTSITGSFVTDLIHIAPHNEQIKIGQTWEKQTIVTGYFENVDRSMTLQHIAGGDEDNTVLSDGAFRGTVDVGDGNNFVDLSRSSTGIGDNDNGLGAFIRAGTGNDVLIGTGANDTIAAGAGFNYLQGGAGSDAYYVSLEDNTITVIRDIENNPISNSGNVLPIQNNNNTVVFAGGITPDALTYRWIGDGDTRLLQLNHGNANVLIESGYKLIGGDEIPYTYGVQKFQFADGSVLTLEELVGNGDDVIGLATPLAEGHKAVDLTMTVSWTDATRIQSGTLVMNLNGDQTLTGGADNDKLYGYTGNDTLIGDAGDDVLDGGSGADTMIGGSGNDTYYVNNVNDVVVENTDEGTDLVQSAISYEFSDNPDIENLTLVGSNDIDGIGNDLDNIIKGNSGSNILVGYEGNDTLNGGMGDDILEGELGADTFIFSQGDGNDEIIYSDSSDVIQLDAAITPDNVFITRDGDDYVIQYKNSEDTIHIVGTSGVNTIQFTDGSNATWTLDNTVNLAQDNIRTITVTASESNGGSDAYILFDKNKLLNNDSISAADGWDVVDARVLDGIDGLFYFGEFYGNQVLAFAAQSAGNASLQYFVQQNGEGPIYAQTIDVNFADKNEAGVITLTGTDGVDLLDAMDAANSVIDGGLGDDYMTGGFGTDTILHRFGDGNDVINLREGSGLLDNLVLLGSTDPGNISFAQDGFNLLININDGAVSETLTVELYFHSFFNEAAVGSIKLFEDEAAYNNWKNDSISNADNVIQEWTPDGVNALRDNISQIISTAGDDTISLAHGDSYSYQPYLDNTVNGAAGDDFISTKDGDDVLIGGLGNDTLVGGSGNDTYKFTVGDGQDIINNFDVNANNDTISQVDIENGLTPTSDTDVLEISGVTDYRKLWFSMGDGDSDGSADDLIINFIGNASSKIVIQDWSNNSENQLDKISINDGTNIYEATNNQLASNDSFDLLIQAMSQFGATPATTDDIPQAVNDANANVNWLVTPVA